MFDGVRMLPCRPITLAGSKTGTVANTICSGCLSRKSSAYIAVLIFADCAERWVGGRRAFPITAAIYWSHVSPCIPAVCYVVGRQPSAWIWIYSHSIACCLLFLLLLELRNIFNSVAWVKLLVAALAVSWWTYWCLHYCCVPAGATLDETSVGQLYMDPLSLRWRLSVARICWCGKGEEDDNERKCEVLRNRKLAWSRDGMYTRQLARSEQDESCCVQPQVKEVSNCPVICSMSVRCLVFVYRDSYMLMLAEIWSVSNINWTFFDRKDIWWCLSYEIPAILH